MREYDVIIIGAGVSGLAAALHLKSQGITPLVLEASDSPGGRMKTDEMDGFLLDRGFHIFLTAYPEAKALLDYDALDFKPFYNGACIRYEDSFHKVADPWRHPKDAIDTITNNIGTMADKLKIKSLRDELLTLHEDDIHENPEVTTLEYLRQFGFSETFIQQFFKPFMAGIFLEPDLNTSSHFFEFVFMMLARGESALPATGGIQTVPRQLAARLLPEEIRYNARVAKIESGKVTLENGETLIARSLLVATDGQDAARLLNEPPVDFNAMTNLYFAMNESVTKDPVLVLNGTGEGIVNNLCVPSLVSPAYAPRGQHLLSVVTLKAPSDVGGEATLVDTVRNELKAWYGTNGVESWRYLKAYVIPRALPSGTLPGHSLPASLSQQVSDGIYRCGDYTIMPTVNGALLSGRRAAEAILTSLKVGAS